MAIFALLGHWFLRKVYRNPINQLDDDPVMVHHSMAVVAKGNKIWQPAWLFPNHEYHLRQMNIPTFLGCTSVLEGSALETAWHFRIMDQIMQVETVKPLQKKPANKKNMLTLTL